jgi:predicted transcriptional regulator
MTASAAQKQPPYGAIVLRKELIDEIDRLAALMNLSREELAEKALLDALEDYDDQLVADKAFAEWEASDKKTFTSSEVRQMLGLDH